MTNLPDQTRNLNPTPAAMFAMIIWGKEYSQYGGGSMDFWNGLSSDRKVRCEYLANKYTLTASIPDHTARLAAAEEMATILTGQMHECMATEGTFEMSDTEIDKICTALAAYQATKETTG